MRDRVVQFARNRARSSTTASRAATSRSRSANWTRRSRSPRTCRTITITTSVTTANGMLLCNFPAEPAAAATLLTKTNAVPPRKRGRVDQAVNP